MPGCIGARHVRQLRPVDERARQHSQVEMADGRVRDVDEGLARGASWLGDVVEPRRLAERVDARGDQGVSRPASSTNSSRASGGASRYVPLRLGAVPLIARIFTATSACFAAIAFALRMTAPSIA
jgi:hypothetical protein